MSLNQPLAWIDLEMTGLDPAVDLIVEVAVILTDGQLENSIEGPELVIHATPDDLSVMSDFVREMHTESGLLDRIGISTIDLARAEADVAGFIGAHVADEVVILAGNSVHTDRAFIQHHMPTLDALLHYRHVDVSTIKELARRWAPEVFENAPAKTGGHRALADIRESIEELRYYRKALFASGFQEPQ